MRSFLKIVLAAIVAVTGFSESDGKRGKSPSVFLETAISKNPAVEGEVMIYDVRLLTTDPSIAGIRLGRNPDFKRLSFSRTAADTHLSDVERDGCHYYSVVIDRFFVEADNVGKFKIQGGEYVVGFNREKVMADPFWGEFVANDVETVVLESPEVDLKVKTLPTKGRPADFSGSVGEFSISVTLPDGDIHAGEEAVALVTIEGLGDLSDAVLPDVRTVFTDGLSLKSMTENRSSYVANGNVGSEIEMECVFIAGEAGSYHLDPCGFVYFNPVKFRYETVESPPIQVTVLPGKTDVKAAPPVYYDI